MSPLDQKGYVAGYLFSAPDQGSEPTVTLEAGTLKQLGSDEDFVAISFYEGQNISTRATVTIEVTQPVQKLVEAVSSTQALESYIAQTANKNLNIEQLIAQIQARPNGEDKEKFIMTLFKAKSINEWVQYMADTLEEATTLLKQQNIETATDLTGKYLAKAKMLSKNARAASLFLRTHSVKMGIDVSKAIDHYNNMVLNVDALLEQEQEQKQTKQQNLPI